MLRKNAALIVTFGCCGHVKSSTHGIMARFLITVTTVMKKGAKKSICVADIGRESQNEPLKSCSPLPRIYTLDIPSRYTRHN